MLKSSSPSHWQNRLIGQLPSNDPSRLPNTIPVNPDENWWAPAALQQGRWPQPAPGAFDLMKESSLELGAYASQKAKNDIDVLAASTGMDSTKVHARLAHVAQIAPYALQGKLEECHPIAITCRKAILAGALTQIPIEVLYAQIDNPDLARNLLQILATSHPELNISVEEMENPLSVYKALAFIVLRDALQPYSSQNLQELGYRDLLFLSHQAFVKSLSNRLLLNKEKIPEQNAPLIFNGPKPASGAFDSIIESSLDAYASQKAKADIDALVASTGMDIDNYLTSASQIDPHGLEGKPDEYASLGAICRKAILANALRRVTLEAPHVDIDYSDFSRSLLQILAKIHPELNIPDSLVTRLQPVSVYDLLAFVVLQEELTSDYSAQDLRKLKYQELLILTDHAFTRSLSTRFSLNNKQLIQIASIQNGWKNFDTVRQYKEWLNEQGGLMLAEGWPYSEAFAFVKRFDFDEPFMGSLLLNDSEPIYKKLEAIGLYMKLLQEKHEDLKSQGWNKSEIDDVLGLFYFNNEQLKKIFQDDPSGIKKKALAQYLAHWLKTFRIMRNPEWEQDKIDFFRQMFYLNTNQIIEFLSNKAQVLQTVDALKNHATWLIDRLAALGPLNALEQDTFNGFQSVVLSSHKETMFDYSTQENNRRKLPEVRNEIDTRLDRQYSELFPEKR